MEISQVKMYCIESLPEIRSGIELQKLSPTFIIYSVYFTNVVKPYQVGHR